jgi:phospholipase/carboxylesterase
MSEITLIEVDSAANPSVAVIWMHGLGADGSDFEPIVPELGLAESPAVRFIFPNAPYRPVTCNGGYVMRAWYDIISLEPDSRQIDETGLLESREIVRQLIQQEEKRGIPSSASSGRFFPGRRRRLPVRTDPPRTTGRRHRLVDLHSRSQADH